MRSVRFFPAGALPLSSLFSAESLADPGLEADGDGFSFSLCPKPEFSPWLYSDFVDGYSKPFALVSRERGYDLYSVFGNGRSAAKGWGLFDASAPGRVISPYIHPSMIADRSGALKPGFSVRLESSTRDSSGFSIGSGTFAGGGAIGYLFEFPVIAEISYTALVPAVQPPAGPDAGQSAPGAGQPGAETEPQTGQTPPEAEPPEGGISAVYAMLDAPMVSYEGHSVSVFDVSEFALGTDRISAERAYGDRLARNSFSFSSPSAAELRRLSRTEARLSFRQAGEFTIGLSVTAGGMEERVNSPIEIRRTPSVSASLSGSQKQNRRQLLQISAAQDPDHPVTELMIVISSSADGDIARIERSRAPGGALMPAGSSTVSGGIFCRAPEDAGSDELFFIAELEFLTKYAQDRTLDYRVTVRDDRGRTSDCRGSFRVEADRAPEARIGIAERYFREPGTNIALIELSDASEGDGDGLAREWWLDPGTGDFVRASQIPGFRDLSLGSGQRILVPKEGVGEFRAALSVTELWAEETLPEFVSDADRLSSRAEASSLVDNVAPVVSLGLRAAPSAELLLLCPPGELAAVRSRIPALEAALIEVGFEPEISAEASLREGEEESGRVQKLPQVNETSLVTGGGTRYGYQVMVSPFWGVKGGMDGRLMGSQSAVTADIRRVYSMKSSVRLLDDDDPTVSRYGRCAPFTLTASSTGIGRDGAAGSLPEAGTVLWRTVIGADSLPPGSDLSKARFAHDEEGLWLYLICGGRTLLFDKESGALIGSLAGELGLLNSARDGAVYSVTERGVVKASLSDGSVRLVAPANAFTGFGCGRMLGGRLCFAAVRDGGLARARFDPRSESLELEPLGSPAAGLICAGMGSDGRLVFAGEFGGALWWNADGSRGELAGSPKGRLGSAAPVRDPSGRISQLVTVTYSSSSDSSRCWLNYYGLDDGSFRSHSSSHPGREPYDASIISYAALSDAGSLVRFSSGSLYEDEIWPGMGNTRPKYYSLAVPGGRESERGGVLTGGLAAGHSAGFVDGGLICMSTALRSSLCHQFTAISETGEAEAERLMAKRLSGSADYTLCCRVRSAEDISELARLIAEAGGAPDLSAFSVIREESRLRPSGSGQEQRSFLKGELVSYELFYSDYEGDPSAASFWRYTHEPLNDGLFELDGQILSSPVRRFYKDGRYTLEHWQRDEAGSFSRDSNVVRVSFLVSGSLAGRPFIESMRLLPARVEEGDPFRIEVKAGDSAGSELRLELRIYRNGELFDQGSRSGLIPGVDGEYPAVSFGPSSPAKAGEYRAVARVYSAHGAGEAELSFTVVQKRSVHGRVRHTDEWDANRRRYNLARCGSEGAVLNVGFEDYAAQPQPRLRGENVFWPGERLELRASVGGDPLHVRAELRGYGLSVRLSDSGEADADERRVFTGSLWDEGLQSALCASGAEEVEVVFTAVYEDEQLSFSSFVIFDDEEGGYRQIRREF